MESRTVTVRSVELKSGGDGARTWTRYTLVADGLKASTFDGRVGRFLQEHVGQTIDVTTERKDRFTDLLTAVEHVDEQASSSRSVPDLVSLAGDPVPSSAVRVDRSSALRAAAAVSPRGTDAADVVHLAEAFLRWIHGESLAAGEPIGAVMLGVIVEAARDAEEDGKKAIQAFYSSRGYRSWNDFLGRGATDAPALIVELQKLNKRTWRTGGARN